MQLAGVGLDAEVVRHTTPDSKKALGPMSYLLTLAQVAGAAAAEDSHRAGGWRSARRQLSCWLGNGRLYGGPFCAFQECAA